MKNKISIAFPTFLVSVICLMGLMLSSGYVNASTELELTVNPSKRSFQLGELVAIDVQMTNRTSTSMYLQGDPYIKIAFMKNENYKLYVPPGPQISFDGIDIPIRIEPNQTINIEKTILWNYKPKVSHLNSDAAKSMLEGKILSDYAFSEAGTYFIKVYINTTENGKEEIIESEPVKIDVAEPSGENLKVWKKIKDISDIAFFIQKGDFSVPIYKTEERKKLEEEVENILTIYPKSIYANSLRQSVEKFNKKEEDRKNFLQKLEKENIQQP